MVESRNIADLRADIAVNLQSGIYEAATKNRKVGIACTFRDQEYQTKLYREGKAPPRVSFHGAHLAFDIFQNIKHHEYDDDFFDVVVPIFKERGFTWMNDITGADKPHFQWDDHRRYSSSQVIAGIIVPPMPKFQKEVIVLDNTPNAHAVDAVSWAINNGILKGDENGNFKLHATATREDILVFMKRLNDIIKK
jgi:hypothetical protein